MKWIGHASFLLNLNGKNVYIDPFNIGSIRTHADIIMITHPHSDHLSPADIRLIASPQTVVFAPKDSVNKIPEGNIVGVEPNRHYLHKDFEFDTVPAYNTVENRAHFHPKGNGWVGYILNINGTRVYHAGDTDFIKEMTKIDTSIALLPMGGTYVMDVNEMIEAARAIKAEKVAPIHYKALLGREGSTQAEKKFLSEVSNGILLNETEPPRYSLD